MQADNRAIFESYYRKYYSQIVIHAYRFLQNWPMANEAAQEAFLIAWRRFEVFQSSENRIGWLKVTAKNVALNMMARALREQKLFISMCEVPESTAAEAEELPVSAELLFQNMMTEDESHLLKRIVLDKATYLELSKELGISVWACQKRMQRLLKKLKSALEDRG
ncbi:sigma-70 family RNA polymerase sigma factor [Flavonifractor sp. An306]|uniref:RNA polymerase sigma factor n=1 Tax=Flavonifractor sp. An306 TaxID=1965629 RepID=UPI0013A6062C|nr:sigma-70 family RNA polymerase sigma factor [Flavonifractor sp. An306]